MSSVHSLLTWMLPIEAIPLCPLHPASAYCSCLFGQCKCLRHYHHTASSPSPINRRYVHARLLSPLAADAQPSHAHTRRGRPVRHASTSDWPATGRQPCLTKLLDHGHLECIRGPIGTLHRCPTATFTSFPTSQPLGSFRDAES